MEQREWIHYLELARLIVIIAYASYFFESPYLLIAATLVIPPSFSAFKNGTCEKYMIQLTEFCNRFNPGFRGTYGRKAHFFC